MQDLMEGNFEINDDFPMPEPVIEVDEQTVSIEPRNDPNLDLCIDTHTIPERIYEESLTTPQFIQTSREETVESH